MYSLGGATLAGSSRRSTRRSRKIRENAMVQCTVPNSLKGHSYLPSHLRQQLDSCEYLSEKTLNQIVYSDRHGREDIQSTLHKMRLAASRQQENMKNFASIILSTMEDEASEKTVQSNDLHNFLSMKSLQTHPQDQMEDEGHMQHHFIIDQENQLPQIESIEMDEREFDLFGNNFQYEEERAFNQISLFMSEDFASRQNSLVKNGNRNVMETQAEVCFPGEYQQHDDLLVFF